MILNRDYIVFTLGALVGAGVAYFVTKRRTQKECYEDYVASQKEEEGEALEPGEVGVVVTDPAKRFNNYVDDLDKRRDEAQRMVRDLNYVTEEKENGPYLIDATEYANGLDGYSNLLVNWYPSVGKATDEIDEKEVFDVANIVGMENLKNIENGGESFGHVRNDEMKCDIEVFVCYAEWPLDDGGGEE